MTDHITMPPPEVFHAQADALRLRALAENKGLGTNGCACYLETLADRVDAIPEEMPSESTQYWAATILTEPRPADWLGIYRDVLAVVAGVLLIVTLLML